MKLKKKDKNKKAFKPFFIGKNHVKHDFTLAIKTLKIIPIFPLNVI